MTAVDDLFAPIDGSDEPWRRECRRLVALLDLARERRRQRPTGALLLEELLERYYVFEQNVFWVVDPSEGTFLFDFNGLVFVNDNGYVALSEPDGEPVIEWNLYPHEEMSLCYVFADKNHAECYERAIHTV